MDNGDHRFLDEGVLEGVPKDNRSFVVSRLSRLRWNVLDMIQITNRGSVATQLFCDIDMSWVEHLRARMRKQGHKVTVTAILLKAIGIAQLKHPASRATMLPLGRVATLNNIVASFTVEKFIDGEPALYFGTIKEPHNKPLSTIAKELQEYAERDVTEIPQLEVEHRFSKMPWLFRRLILWLGLRFPAIRLRYLGATFGLSSLGKYGIKLVIPPCVCTSTFGIGAVENRPVARGGAVVIRPIMGLVLNFDHRLIDGAPAARFLQDVRLLLEGELAKYLTHKTEAEVSLDEAPLPTVQYQ